MRLGAPYIFTVYRLRAWRDSFVQKSYRNTRAFGHIRTFATMITRVLIYDALLGLPSCGKQVVHIHITHMAFSSLLLFALSGSAVAHYKPISFKRRSPLLRQSPTSLQKKYGKKYGKTPLNKDEWQFFLAGTMLRSRRRAHVPVLLQCLTLQ